MEKFIFEKPPLIKCCIKKCSRSMKIRGLCTACYSEANRYVRKGIISWEGLEGLGLAKPLGFRKAKRRSIFFETLQENGFSIPEGS